MSLAFADVSADLQGRNDEELKFFLANGRWPAIGSSDLDHNADR